MFQVYSYINGVKDSEEFYTYEEARSRFNELEETLQEGDDFLIQVINPDGTWVVQTP